MPTAIAPRDFAKTVFRAHPQLSWRRVIPTQSKYGRMMWLINGKPGFNEEVQWLISRTPGCSESRYYIKAVERALKTLCLHKEER